MVWNCPHCRAALALSDDVLGSSWNVSQCPNCENSGFIRRPGNHAIKVDQVPAGEKVLIAKTIAKPTPVPQPKKAVTAQPSLNRTIRTSATQVAPRASSMTVEGKTPWPVIPIKPVIRPAVRRNLKPTTPATPLMTAQAAKAPETPIQNVAQAILDATVILKTPEQVTKPAISVTPMAVPVAVQIQEERTTMVTLTPEPTGLIAAVPMAEQKMITPPEFTREILQDSGFIDKSKLTRSFEIPKMQAMIAVGHSVKGSKKKKKKSEEIEFTTTVDMAIPEPLPELPPQKPSSILAFFSEMTTIIPTLAFIVISGFIGWNAVRYSHGTPAERHEIVDHLSQRAMAPLRATRASSKDVYAEKYTSNDDPTQLRTRSTEVQAYTGPGVEYNPTGVLKPGHLYSVLEKDGNWIKFALDQTHAAWVSIAGVDLIR